MPCFGSCLVCLGACLLGISSYAHYHSRWLSSRTADETHHPKCRSLAPPSLAARLALGCSLVASAGLAGVGAVDEIECWPLHATCAVCFFGGMCAWSVLDLATSTGKWVGVTRAAGVISAAVAIEIGECRRRVLVHHKTHQWIDCSLDKAVVVAPADAYVVELAVISTRTWVATDLTCGTRRDGAICFGVVRRPDTPSTSTARTRNRRARRVACPCDS